MAASGEVLGGYGLGVLTISFMLIPTFVAPIWGIRPQVGVDLFEVALGKHCADHLGGGATPQALGQRQGDVLGPLGGGAERGHGIR